MTPTVYTIDGEKYSAWSEGTFTSGTTWMVRWWKIGPNQNDDENDYVESLLTVQTSDPEEAIRAAISKGSWS